MKKKIIFIRDIDPIKKRPIASEYQHGEKDVEDGISNSDDQNNKVISTIGENSKEHSIIYQSKILSSNNQEI